MGHVARVVHRIEDPEDVHAVLGRLLHEPVNDLVVVMAVTKQVLAAQQHLQTRVREQLAEGPQAHPRVFVEESDTAVVSCSAPALDRPVAGGVDIGARLDHVLHGHPGCHQALMTVPEHKFGDANFAGFGDLNLSRTHGAILPCAADDCPTGCQLPVCSFADVAFSAEDSVLASGQGSANDDGNAMCGFTAFISSKHLDDARARQVADGMLCARHRGPDDTDVWHDDRVALGFNRLSIIDIEGSPQPLRWGPADNPERYVMVFNGEIYNFVELRAQLIRDDHAEFHTSGDGEAIVAGYHYHGADWVRQLRGMFTFVIWDSQESQAFGARDWFGIKPLYYAQLDDGFAFSSEAKSLREFTGAGEGGQAGAGALPGAAVRPRTGVGGRQPAADRVRHHVHRPRRRVDLTALLPATVRRQPGQGSRRSAGGCTTRSSGCWTTRWPSTCAPT